MQKYSNFFFFGENGFLNCGGGNPAGNYMFKVNNRNTRTLELNFEHISDLVLVFLLLTLSK